MNGNAMRRKAIGGVVLAAACLMVCAGVHDLRRGSTVAQRSFVTAQTGSPHLHRASLHTQQPAAATPLSTTETDELYQDKCALCHEANRTGKPPAFPTLIGVTTKYSDAEITGQIRNGKGRMPAFKSLTDDEVKALVNYLKTPPSATGKLSRSPEFSL